MKKISIFVLVLFFFSLLGCASEQASMPKTTTENEIAEVKTATIIKDTTEITKTEVKEESKAVVPVQEDIEEIISQGGWAFSVYDPETGIEEYYNKNGGLLGREKK